MQGPDVLPAGTGSATVVNIGFVVHLTYYSSLFFPSYITLLKAQFSLYSIRPVEEEDGRVCVCSRVCALREVGAPCTEVAYFCKQQRWWDENRANV